MAYVMQPFTSLPLYKVKDTKGPIQRKALCMGPYTRVDCDLTLCRLKHMYYGRPYAKVDLDPMPESTLFPRQGLRIWPQYRYCVSYVGAILPQPSEKVEAYLHIFYVFPKGYCTICPIFPNIPAENVLISFW